MDCEHCKKTFSNKQNLKAHQKRAKYCLEIQGVEMTGEILIFGIGFLAGYFFRKYLA